MITGKILFKNYQIPTEQDFPLLNSIKFCGEIPSCVLEKASRFSSIHFHVSFNISQIDNVNNRTYLRDKSQNKPRANFVQYFNKHGRSWLQKEIESNSIQLVDFVNRTLVYDPDER